MSTLITQKCSVCSASLANPPKWIHTRTVSNRSATNKRSSSKPDVNRARTAQASVQSFEDEYIKQLQLQISSLETECLYLRGQVSAKPVQVHHVVHDDRLLKVEQDRADLQRTLLQSSSQFDQLSSENYGLTVAMDELRRKFDVEKQTLLDELALLRRSKDALEQEKLRRDQELRLQSRASIEESKNAQGKIGILEQQLTQQINQNQGLSGELHQVKLQSANLQRSLNDHQVVSRERDRLQGTVAELERELKTLRQEAKSHENRFNDIQSLRNQLTEEKNMLIKEVTRVETLARDFERECEQLRLVLGERADALQSKERDIAALRKKEQTFRSMAENLQAQLETESIKNKDLDGQLKQLQRQVNIEIQNALVAKREVSDYESRHRLLQEELHVLQRDKDHLNGHLHSLQQRLLDEEKLSVSLRLEIEHLEIRVKEIDRLKALEDLIQSQRWEDISQMAHAMQNVSRTMSQATSPTALRRKRLDY